MQSKDLPSIVIKSLVSFAIAPLLLSTVFVTSRYDKTIAQAPAPAPTFPLPTALPAGTTVKLDGSSSMTAVNNELKKRFEERFPGSVISLSTNGSDAAMQALQKGEIDLAAIGRTLTDAEKTQGLAEAPIGREKIAIIVGSANPFKGSITDEQFVRIYRGEIKNWSELGGPNVPIRVIDRPASSDTRQSLSRYPGFNSGPMQPGANAVEVSDDTGAVIGALGSDGIGYAIVSQVANQPITILPLFDTLPSDPSYPYSQPRNYVYKGQPSPAIVAFLGFATSAPGQEAVQQANQQEAAAIQVSPAAPAPAPTATAPNAAVVPTPTVTAPDTALVPAPAPAAGFDLSRLWWLLIPLLGIPLLFWLLRGRGDAVPAAVSSTRTGRMILVARNCRDAYAYWEIPNEDFEVARRQGGRDLKVRLHDVTDDSGLDWQDPYRVQEFACPEAARDLHIPVAVDDRTYAAELGYVTEQGEWIRLAHSEPVHVPACDPGDRQDVIGTAATLAAGGAVATGATAAARSFTRSDSPTVTPPVVPVPPPPDLTRSTQSRIVMTPRSTEEAYVSWDVPESEKAALQAQGGRKLTLRIHDVTNRDISRQAAHSVRQYECDEFMQDKQVPISVMDLVGTDATGRDYMAELGYLTDDNRWLSLTRSDVVHVAVPSSPNPPSTYRGGTVETVREAVTGTTGSISDGLKSVGGAIAGGAAAVAGIGAAKSSLEKGQTINRDVFSKQSPDCRIILVPLNSRQAYAYWEVAEPYKQALRERGGRKLTLRIHDATNIDIDYQLPHSTQTYVCGETDQDQHVTIPAGNRDYIADLGYFTDDNRWLRLIRSMHVHIPSDQ